MPLSGVSASDGFRRYTSYGYGTSGFLQPVYSGPAPAPSSSRMRRPNGHERVERIPKFDARSIQILAANATAYRTSDAQPLSTPNGVPNIFPSNPPPDGLAIATEKSVTNAMPPTSKELMIASPTNAHRFARPTPIAVAQTAK